eukprot:2561619-Rhodomonas_salina.2
MEVERGVFKTNTTRLDPHSLVPTRPRWVPPRLRSSVASSARCVPAALGSAHHPPLVAARCRVGREHLLLPQSVLSSPAHMPRHRSPQHEAWPRLHHEWKRKQRAHGGSVRINSRAASINGSTAPINSSTRTKNGSAACRER